MPRSGKEARLRLRQATLELFQQQGYDATTAAEIAARAGLTERTFFRHFADKREALFDGEEEFRDTLTRAVVEAPAELRPLEALLRAFRAVEPILEANRAFSVPRQAIIARTTALQERAAAKAVRLTAALADALLHRDVDEPTAAIASQVGMAMLGSATQAWMDDPTCTLGAQLEQNRARLQELLKSHRGPVE